MELPLLLDVPKVFLPLIYEINNYRYFVIEGGRNSCKSHTVARWILYLAEFKKLRIICGREIQKSIEDSVFALLSDLIREYNLFFDIKKSTIAHKETGSTIRFIGLREQGATNLKSLEGCDILWVEEAQSITKFSLDILIPTIRKTKAKLFFTMNRYIRTDPVYKILVGRKDTLHIKANYKDIESKYISNNVLIEAEECKKRNIKDYNHIWLGQPLTTTSDYLFNMDKLDKVNSIQPFGDLIKRQKVMGVDFASGGGDLCVAKLIERTSNVHWEETNQEAWDNPDTDESVGKVISLFGQWNPDILVCDAGGLGYPMFISLSKIIHNIIGFDGAKNDKVSDPMALNNRFQAYSDLKYWIDKEWIRITCQHTKRELETIKKKYGRNGKIRLLTKEEQRKEGTQSQDRADALAMAVFGAVHYLGKVDFSTVDKPIGMRISRVNKKKQTI